METDNIHPDDASAVRTIAMGMVMLALALFVLTRILKFRFVLGVGD